MANEFIPSNNSVIVDTVFTDADTFFKVLGSGPLLNKAPSLKVKKIDWANPSGDLIIKDRAGETIFFKNAPAEDAEYLMELWWRKGWAVTTLGGGTVTVYFE